jgi:hypothetical protein
VTMRPPASRERRRAPSRCSGSRPYVARQSMRAARRDLKSSTVGIGSRSALSCCTISNSLGLFAVKMELASAIFA